MVLIDIEVGKQEGIGFWVAAYSMTLGAFHFRARIEKLSNPSFSGPAWRAAGESGRGRGGGHSGQGWRFS